MHWRPAKYCIAFPKTYFSNAYACSSSTRVLTETSYISVHNWHNWPMTAWYTAPKITMMVILQKGFVLWCAFFITSLLNFFQNHIHLISILLNMPFTLKNGGWKGTQKFSPSTQRNVLTCVWHNAKFYSHCNIKTVFLQANSLSHENSTFIDELYFETSQSLVESKRLRFAD